MTGVRLLPLAADRQADVGLSNAGRANAFLRRAAAFRWGVDVCVCVSTSWPAAILDRGTLSNCTICALGPDRR
jgi:hypothetical protein